MLTKEQEKRQESLQYRLGILKGIDESKWTHEHHMEMADIGIKLALVACKQAGLSQAMVKAMIDKAMKATY